MTNKPDEITVDTKSDVKKPAAPSDSWKAAREGFSEEDCFRRGFKVVSVEAKAAGSGRP